jgi:membrane protein
MSSSSSETSETSQTAGTTPPTHPDGAPDKPSSLPRREWGAVLKRTWAEFRDDDLTDWAAALTYYGVLSIFPALIALVSILGLIGASATQPLIDNLATVAPGPAKQILTDALKNLQQGRGAAGALFFVGLGSALWAASGYVGGFGRAANAIYEVEEGRPFWLLRPLQLLITAVLLVMLAASAVAVVVTGPLARQVGDLVGVGGAAVTVWDIAKWPVLVLVVSLMFSILYYATPNVRQPGFRWITPGGVLAVLLWIVASALFAFYVANFGSYNKTYGALGGVIAFLVWLWISNLAILVGAEFNAELERGRRIEAGQHPDEEPFVTPRAPAD